MPVILLTVLVAICKIEFLPSCYLCKWKRTKCGLSWSSPPLSSVSQFVQFNSEKLPISGEQIKVPAVPGSVSSVQHTVWKEKGVGRNSDGETKSEEKNVKMEMRAKRTKGKTRKEGNKNKNWTHPHTMTLKEKEKHLKQKKKLLTWFVQSCCFIYFCQLIDVSGRKNRPSSGRCCIILEAKQTLAQPYSLCCIPVWNFFLFELLSSKMVSCAVYGCLNRSNSTNNQDTPIHFYRFPKSPSGRKEKWILFAARKKYGFQCFDHKLYSNFYFFTVQTEANGNQKRVTESVQLILLIMWKESVHWCLTLIQPFALLNLLHIPAVLQVASIGSPIEMCLKNH